MMDLRSKIIAAQRQSPTTLGEVCTPPDMKETLNELAKTFVEHARPVIREDVLPILQADERLQRNLGNAMGETFARRLAPWVIFGTIITTVGVAYNIFGNRS